MSSNSCAYLQPCERPCPASVAVHSNSTRHLERGADGYVRKPFGRNVLLGHIRAKLRRVEQARPTMCERVPLSYHAE